jgi:hypothetical protein
MSGCGGNDSARDGQGGPPDKGAGPMRVGNPAGSSLTAAEGTVFTDGFQQLAMDDGFTGRIDSVELVGDPGVRLLGAMIAPPPRRTALEQIIWSWPPTTAIGFDPSTAVPAEGAEIGSLEDEPMGWELLLGLKVEEPGKHTRRAIRVTYEVGEDLYRVDLPTYLTVCTGPEYETRGRCAFDEELPG